VNRIISNAGWHLNYADVSRNSDSRVISRAGEVPYQELTVYIASVKDSVPVCLNQTSSTVCTCWLDPKRGDSDVFSRLSGLILEFKNQIVTRVNEIVLSLLTNPNRGLKVFLGDVTVAIGGF
jgi:hypothetical protein